MSQNISKNFDSYAIWYNSSAAFAAEAGVPAWKALPRLMNAGERVAEVQFYDPPLPDEARNHLAGDHIVLYYSAAELAVLLKILDHDAEHFSVFLNLSNGHANIRVGEIPRRTGPPRET